MWQRSLFQSLLSIFFFDSCFLEVFGDVLVVLKFFCDACRIKELGAELLSESYEKSNEVSEREAYIDSLFAQLLAGATARRPVLDDHLAREQYKEQTLMLNEQHIDRYTKLNDWRNQKSAYLQVAEQIGSVREAHKHLSILDAYVKEKGGMDGSVVQFKVLTPRLNLLLWFLCCCGCCCVVVVVFVYLVVVVLLLLRCCVGVVVLLLLLLLCCCSCCSCCVVVVVRCCCALLLLLRCCVGVVV